MMANIITPTRVFRMGATRLPDPDPSATPLDALRLFVPNYPALAHATLGEPVVEGDQLVYPVEKPPAKTKG